MIVIFLSLPNQIMTYALNYDLCWAEIFYYNSIHSILVVNELMIYTVKLTFLT